MVGTIVMFVPKDDKAFPYILNGAKELPAIIIQDFGGYQNLGVFTPYDGVKTAWSIPEGREDYNQGYWYKNGIGIVNAISGVTKKDVEDMIRDMRKVPFVEKSSDVIINNSGDIKLGETKYPIQKNKKSNKK